MLHPDLADLFSDGDLADFFGTAGPNTAGVDQRGTFSKPACPSCPKEIQETKGAWVITLDTAGFRTPAELQITLTGQTLKVQGSKQCGATNVACFPRTLIREFDLTTARVDYHEISATRTQDGALQITLPKTQEAAARNIRIVPVSTEPFVATSEWQTIKPGQALPAGLHVAVDMQTGQKRAKLVDTPATAAQPTVAHEAKHVKALENWKRAKLMATTQHTVAHDAKHTEALQTHAEQHAEASGSALREVSGSALREVEKQQPNTPVPVPVPVPVLGDTPHPTEATNEDSGSTMLALEATRALATTGTAATPMRQDQLSGEGDESEGAEPSQSTAQ